MIPNTPKFAPHPFTAHLPYGEARLADALDTHLCVSPGIRDFWPDPRGLEKLRICRAPPGSIIRQVRTPDRILTVVAIPNIGDDDAPRSGREIAARWTFGKSAVCVTESWLLRQPRLDIKSALVMAGDCRLARQDRLMVEQHLLDVGGSSCLADCAAHVLLDDDPVRCVLALVEQGALRIDYARPLSCHSIISLPVRRDRGRLVVGG